MAVKPVTIRISAEDSFSSVVQRYNAAVSESARVTNQATQAAEKNEGALRNLQNVLGGIGVTLGARQVLSIVEDMNALGQQVVANERIFNQLTMAMGGNERMMLSLRAATGGVVDDLTLMSGANQLLRLRITENVEQTSHLVDMIVKLKAPTEDLQSSISNFTLMLSNQSIARLDSFGLSAGIARQRMAELKDEGLDTAAAFRQAVFEQMEDQVTRLGDAADVAQTNLAKIQTMLENVWQTASRNINISVDTLAGFLLAIMERGDVAGAILTAAVSGQPYQSPISQPQFQQQELIARNYVRSLPNYDPFAYRPDTMLWSEDPLLSKEARGVLSGIVRTLIPNLQRALADRMTSLSGGIGSIMSDARWFSMEPIIPPPTGLYESIMGQIAQSQAEIARNDRNMFAPAAGPTYLTESQAAQVRFHAEQIAQAAKYAKDNYAELLTQQQLNMIQSAADGAMTLADAADAAAEAFKNLSLSDILGTSAGGILGEITDQLLAAGRAAGWSEEKLTAYQDALDLMSGRQTEMSKAFEEQVIPSLMNLSPEDAAKAAANWAASMRLAAQNNIPFDRLQQFGLGTFGGMFGGGTRELNIGMGQGINEVLAQNPWLSREQLMAAAGTGGGRYIRAGSFQVPTGSLLEGFNPQDYISSIMQTLMGGGETFGIGGEGTNDPFAQAIPSVEEIASLMDEAASSVDQMDRALGKISGKTTELKFKVTGIPDWLEGLLTGGSSFFEAIESTVRDNGGQTPGAKGSTPRGGKFIPTE